MSTDTTVQENVSFVFVDPDNPYQQSAIGASAGSFDFRKLMKSALEHLESKSTELAAFKIHLEALYYQTESDQTAALKAVDTLASTPYDVDGHCYEKFAAVTHDELLQHLADAFTQLPMNRSSQLLIQAISTAWPDGAHTYFFNLAELALHLLTASHVIVPIGTPAVGYACKFDVAIYSRYSKLAGEAVIRYGSDALIPLFQFFELEAYWRDSLITHYSTLQFTVTNQTNRIAELEQQCADLKKQAQKSNPYTWEV